MQLPPKGSSLLNYAISRLSPEVFCHPVWMRFGKKEVSESLRTIDDLLSIFKILEKDDPGIACQVLMICAIYQNQTGQQFEAIRTTQHALSLSQSNNLVRESIWALWGMCAILIQQGKIEQACAHLVDLQAALSEQNEWILANFIDVIRQSIIVHQEGVFELPTSYPDQDTFTFSLDWLLHWGFSTQSFNTGTDKTSQQLVNFPAKHSSLHHSFFSIQHWQGRWHTLLLAIRGELRLQWTANDAPSTNRRFSFWGSILASVRLFLAGRNINMPPGDPIPQIPNTALPPPAEEIPPPKPPPRNKKAVAGASKSKATRKSKTPTPVAVHMLGTFSMTIGNSSIKLPTSRSLSILKYLLFHRKQHVTREGLMDLFWPDSELETARNSLDVALHGLRKALRNAIPTPVILFQEGGYTFAPDFQIWLDVEEFERCVQAGQRLEDRNQRSSAISEYEAAISLYQGDFLEQNPYEEWTVLIRERLRITYLDTLDRLSRFYFEKERYAACVAICQRILDRDPCREDTHCILMRCFSRQGQNHLALRQYQVCVEVLRLELDVVPSSETTSLYQDILHHKRV